MKPWMQTRLAIVLIALALIPAATLPLAERLRSEWAKFWEPEPTDAKWDVDSDGEGRVDAVWIDIGPVVDGASSIEWTRPGESQRDADAPSKAGFLGQLDPSDRNSQREFVR